MHEVLVDLLEGVIDYAGLFPPAKLELPKAVQEYQTILDSQDAWLVSRFAIGAGQLPALSQFLRSNPDIEAMPIAVIGAADPQNFEATARQDRELMLGFSTDVGAQASIEAYEVRISKPEHLLTVNQTVKKFAEAECYVEVGWEEGQSDLVSAIAEYDDINAKARTGGLTAESFPNAETLSRFLLDCIQLELPFKLTAGLHHPFPFQDPTTGGKMHGFINILIATGLALKYELSTSEIADILCYTQSEFSLVAEGLACGELTLDSEEILEMRDLFHSFGSCSVSEPVGDLAKAGWLNG